MYITTEYRGGLYLGIWPCTYKCEVCEGRGDNELHGCHDYQLTCPAGQHWRPPQPVVSASPSHQSSHLPTSELGQGHSLEGGEEEEGGRGRGRGRGREKEKDRNDYKLLMIAFGLL